MALMLLKDLLEYCEEYLEYRPDGNLYWKKNKGQGKQGALAGSVYWCGYRAIKIKKTTNYVHRIIFAIHHKERDNDLLLHIQNTFGMNNNDIQHQYHS